MMEAGFAWWEMTLLLFCTIVGPIVLLLVIAILIARLTMGKCRCTTDLTGKTIVITGANSGIGLETAIDMARRNPSTVILACRSETKGKWAEEHVRGITGNMGVVFRHCDVSSMASVREFVRGFLEDFDRLDILINNAGINAPKRLEKTAEGLEVTMATNFFGHFLLTLLLLERLKAAGTSRVVTLTSRSFRSALLDLGNLNSERYFNRRVFANSKLANYLFAMHLGQQLKGSGIVSVSAHPGAVNTHAWDSTRCIVRALASVAACLRIMKTPIEGAQTSIHCAIADSVTLHNGEFYMDCRPRRVAGRFASPESANLLWYTGLNYINPYAMDGGLPSYGEHMASHPGDIPLTQYNTLPPPYSQSNQSHV